VWEYKIHQVSTTQFYSGYKCIWHSSSIHFKRLRFLTIVVHRFVAMCKAGCMQMTEASGSAPDSPAGHSGALNAYTKQALDDLVSKILDEDSSSCHLNGTVNRHMMNCDEFQQNIGHQRFVFI